MHNRIFDHSVPDITKIYSKQLDKLARLLGSDQGSKERIQTEWDRTSNDVRILFAGGSIMLNSTFALSIRMTTFQTWRDNLSNAMRWSLGSIAETMIQTNKEFAAAFYGTNGINVSTSDEPILSNSSAFESLKVFDLALISRSQKIIDWLWKDNTNLWRALVDLQSKDLEDYDDFIIKAKNAGYELKVENDQASLRSLKRKAEDVLESDKNKRANTNESPTAEKVTRYLFRYSSGSQLSHFGSNRISSASLNSDSSDKNKVTSHQPSGGF